MMCRHVFRRARHVSWIDMCYRHASRFACAGHALGMRHSCAWQALNMHEVCMIGVPNACVAYASKNYWADIGMHMYAQTLAHMCTSAHMHAQGQGGALNFNAVVSVTLISCLFSHSTTVVSTHCMFAKHTHEIVTDVPRSCVCFEPIAHHRSINYQRTCVRFHHRTCCWSPKGRQAVLEADM